MDLPIELVKEFAKTTNDETIINEGGTVYGRYILQNDNAFVEIDGSDGTLTPVATTSTAKNGDRVTVLIKDHTAIVTGNLTDPSASSEDVDNVKKQMGTAALDLKELKEKLENQEITLQEYEEAIAEAKRQATDYIDFTTGVGLVIGSSTISNNVRIYSGGIDIRENNTILASYTDDKISLGVNSVTSKIELCSGVGYIYGIKDNENFLHELSISSAGHLILQSRSSQCGVILGSSYKLEVLDDAVSFYKASTADIIWYMSSTLVELGPYGVSPRIKMDATSGNLVGDWNISGRVKMDTLNDDAASGQAKSYKLLVAGSTGILYKSNVSLNDLTDGSMKVTAVFG